MRQYGEEMSEIILQQLLGWRSLHSQGRGMNSVMINTRLEGYERVSHSKEAVAA